jgi:hypothetical protein
MLTNRDYDLISEYLDDALSVNDRAEVERRAASDPEFAAELEAIRRTVALIKTLPTLAAPRDFRLTRQQADRIDRDRRPAAAPRRAAPLIRWAMPVLSAVASALLVVIGMVALLGSPRQPNTQTASVAMLAVTEVVDEGETAAFGAFESANADAVPLPADLKTNQPDATGLGGMGDSLPAVGQDAMAFMAAPEGTAVPTEAQPEDSSTAAEMSMRSAVIETTATATLEQPGAAGGALLPAPSPTRAAQSTATLTMARPTVPASYSAAPITPPVAPEMATESSAVAELDVQAGPPDATLSAETLPDDAPAPLLGLLMVAAGLALGALTLTMVLRRRG